MLKPLSLLLLFATFAGPAGAKEKLVFTSRDETETYYRALVNRHRAGKPASLADFNRTFAPAPAAPPVAIEGFLRCLNRSVKEPGCAPDTFYSWGPAEKLAAIAKNTPDGQRWHDTSLNGDRQVYMNPSSIATFCYGRLPIRFKMKTPALLGALNSGIWSSSHFLEWIIPPTALNADANDAIDSVSYAQPEHFDEMAIELQRRMDEDSRWQEAPLYVSSRNNSSLATRLSSGCVAERLPNEASTMIENLVIALEAVFAGQGWVHTQGRASRDSAEHFRTEWPTFFNPL